MNKVFVAALVVSWALAAILKLMGYLPDADWWWMVLFTLSPLIGVLTLALLFIALAILVVLFALLTIFSFFLMGVFAYATAQILGLDVETIARDYQ